MRPQENSRRATALIVVLASLVFLAALVLAFLASVGTELRSSKAYSAGANAKLLAQSAVNLAMAQINDATTGTNSSGVVAWASQPGMIRTYDSSGNPANYYKLFSWTDMSGSGAYDPTLATNTVPANWSSQKAIFTDLNQPLRIPDGTTNKVIYPIIDGNGLSTYTNNTKTYLTNSAPAVDGFYISGTAPTASANATANPVPMPVKWLYLLESGKIVAPVTTSVPTQASIPGASSTNQIVGRIAFWTDDESCKININTASEGTYADMPRATYYNSVEGVLVKNQPVQGEYQRYPGHPATTALSTVLKKPSTLTDTAWAEELYDVLPRVKTGGSHEGTVLTTKGAAATGINADGDRLFASVDELAFKPMLSGTTRIQNDSAGLTKDVLPRDRFFLTAFSRAPDVNLFNKPRVSIWPIYENAESTHLTAFDQLMAFCGTINHSIYYFQRKDPTSPTIDLPAVSAAGGLGRNRALLEYLRFLTGLNIPGFGGNFRAKYGSDNDQILTEIFDYIRCTNLADNTLTDPSKRFTVVAVGSSSPNFPGLGQVVPITDTSTATRGFGRFRTVQGASVHFIANVDGDKPETQLDANGVALSGSTKVAAGHVRVQAMFLLQLADPSVGSIFDNPNFKWSVSGLNTNLKWGSSEGTYNMSFPGDGVTFTVNNYPIDGAYYGDQFGLSQLAGQTGSKYVCASVDFPKAEPIVFSGGDVTVKLMNPSGLVLQTIVLNIPGSATLPVPQTGSASTWTGAASGKNMRYFTNRIFYTSSRDPAGAWLIDQTGPDASGGSDVIRSVGPVAGDIRLIAARETTPLPGQADYPFAKINAALWDTPAGVMGMHTLWSGAGEPYYGALIGSLASNLKYESNILSASNPSFTLNNIVTRSSLGIPISAGPDAPFNGVAVGKNSAYVAGDLVGDFDNAPGTLRDGPFINKPDEGSQGDASKAPYDWTRGLNGNYMSSPTLFTPNRLISSAVTFGSLPTGVFANRPWQTLLFHCDPTGLHPGNKGRKGDGSPSGAMPADHLLLDLFTMPIVEPYAISEPLSTAGRINMNYQIIPFTYINRDTGIRAVLKAEKVVAIKDSDVAQYKIRNTTSMSNIRYDVNADETLKGFQQRFDNKDIFRSASEICDLPIVPVGFTFSGMSSFWNSYRLTGDNSKERPYATIYPRLTTKSNTFTIYYRVQALKKIKTSNPAIWDDATDKVDGEFRGYQTVERYVDPNNPNIPDYANTSVTTPLSTFYKFRVLQSKQFAP